MSTSRRDARGCLNTQKVARRSIERTHRALSRRQIARCSKGSASNMANSGGCCGPTKTEEGCGASKKTKIGTGCCAPPPASADTGGCCGAAQTPAGGEGVKEALIKDGVKEYYGETLKSTADLKTSACCTGDGDRPTSRVLNIIRKIPEAVVMKFYGCGYPVSCARCLSPRPIHRRRSDPRFVSSPTD